MKCIIWLDIKKNKPQTSLNPLTQILKVVPSETQILNYSKNLIYIRSLWPLQKSIMVLQQ